MKGPSSFFVFFAACISGLGGFLFGYNTAVVSGAILFIKKDFSLSTFDTELVMSSILVGAIFGALSFGRISDLIGRKKAIYLVALFYLLGLLVSTLAPFKEVLVIGRAVLGVGVGAASVIIPLYISEISPHRMRGALVAINQVMLAFGILASYLIDLAFAHSGSWRSMLGFAFVPTLFMIAGMFFLPESPRWLLKKERIKEANQACRNLYGKEYQSELEEVKKGLQTKETTKVPLFQKAYAFPLFLGISLSAFQQLSGINVVTYYAPTIFKMTGFESNVTAILATVGLGIVNLLMTLLSVQLIDRLGRRLLLLWGLWAMLLSLAALGFAFQLKHLLPSLVWVTLISLIVYMAAFAISLGPVFWVFVSEIYPFSIRGRAMSWAMLTNWAANLLVVSTFLTFTHLWGKALTFWLYGLILLLALLFVYLFLPETKGKSLEEIEKFWKKI